MFSIILQNIVLLVSICIAFYLGRYFAIIKRNKLVEHDVTDIFEDVKSYVDRKETAQPTARIISPSKRKAMSLKELEDMSL